MTLTSYLAINSTSGVAMESKDVYVQTLIAQYRAFRLELDIFTCFFMLAIMTVPVAWIINHVYHNFTLGWMIGFVALILGLSMATHCGNTLQSLKRIATDLNKAMSPLATFEYDLGKEAEPLRYAFTLAGKIIGCVILLWCFWPWPQL